MGTLINIGTYEGLWDSEFDGKELPEPGLVRVDYKDIEKFFCMVKYTTEEYTVITPGGDVSLCYQKEHPINHDFACHMQFHLPLIINDLLTGDGFRPLLVPPRCEPAFCRISDELSVKIDSYTYKTFSEPIPKNILHWYAANCNIIHPKITHLPIGANAPIEPCFENVGDDWGFCFDRLHRVYANFSGHTLQREQIKTFFRNDPNFFIVDKLPNEAGITHDQFIADMRHSVFCLCPTGIGLDCFRVWEALLCGSIPILERDHWNAWMPRLFPVLLVEDFRDITTDILKTEFRNITSRKWNREYITEDYWANLILNTKNALHSKEG